MDFEILPVNKIKYAPYNPRKISKEMLAKLEKSIKDFGYVEPIVVNKRTMHVVGGNQRLKVLKQMGIKEVQAVIVDLDDTHEKALNLALNKISGEWDLPLLKDLLLELNTGEIDTEITGFDMPEIEELMNQFHIEGEEDNFNVDEVVEEIEEPITQRGDIYLFGRHRLMCGDSTIKEDVEKLMDGKKADVGITDPPYGVRREEEWDEVSNFLNNIKTWFLYYRENADKGLIWFCADKMLPHLVTQEGYERLLIWNKPAGSQFAGASHNNLWYSMEPILIFDWGGLKKNCGTNDYEYSVFDSRTIPKSKEGHPTTKPIVLMIWLIKHYSKTNQIILDLFLGSGSTLIACEQTNRICYGMEIDPVYCDVIVKRWEEYTGKKAELLGNQNGSTIKINSGS